MLRLGSKGPTFHKLFLLSVFGFMILTQGISAQPKRRSTANAAKQAQRPASNFEPGQPINLSLKRCSATPAIQVSGITATNLEIEGGRITLTNGAGDSISGEVKAYSRSAHSLDANVGLIFGRMNVPFTDASWKPPIMISLVFRQNRGNPKKLLLNPAEGLNPDFPVTRISCASVNASAE